MPAFFIDRPVFAWVVALLICLGGLLAIPFLAVAQYPIIAPPSISISTSYPGASPENLYNSVTRLIEEELNGANGILNFESTSDSLGQVEITANFVPGTDTSAASVEVQNRIKRVEARLPRAVMQQGILIEEASSAVLQIITLRSTDGSLDEVGLGDFMVRNILGEIRRIPGVGRATLYSTERALRVWIDPTRLVGFGLTADDVTKAISAQNAQVASGSIGVEPSNADQQISAMVLVKGQFATPEEFGAIVLRANPGRLDRAAARRGADRSRRPELSVHHAPQRRAGRRPFGAARAQGQCARDRERRQGEDGGAVEIFPGQHQIRHPLRHHAGGRGFDQEGADHAGGGRGAGVPGDAAVPAEHPLHDHSDHRRAGGAARHLRHSSAARLFHQRADAVRHGARHRHPGRRRDRRGGECRAHHVRGGAVAARRHPQGDAADHRRHHRHHAGADVGVRADGVLSRLGRHHLSAILRLHDRGDRLVVAAGAVAHAGLVRDHAQAGCGGPSSRGARPVRLVQPPHGGGQGRLCGVGALVDPARRAPDAGLCGDARRRRFRLHPAAGRLSAGRRPGLHHRRRAHAAGGVVSAHARRRQARRGLSDESAKASTP